MSDKCNADGTPNVLYLEDVINEKWGSGTARVMCPITDPFPVHHGALGSFVRVHLLANKDKVAEIMEYCKSFPQVELILQDKEACEKFDLPLDREGDFVAVSIKHAVIGSCKDEHNLSNLDGHRLRSHGGISEQGIPLLMSRPVKDGAETGSRQWRNFDAYDLVLNF